MRIFCGGIHMEANSFSPLNATEATFHKGYWVEEEQLETLRPTSAEGRGVLQFLDAHHDVELVLGLYAHAISSGPIVQKTFDAMSGVLLDKLKQAGRIDGVLLLLHGACQAEDTDDCEGYIMEQVRAIVGPDVPIVTSLDLHACLTEKMVKNLNGVAAYLTFPHIDHATTGHRAALYLLQLIQSGTQPKKLHKTIPLIMSTTCETFTEPLLTAMERYKALLDMPGVMSGALCLTQPWLDTPELGCSLTIFYNAEADPKTLEGQMDAILQHLWVHRTDFYPVQPDLKQGIEMCRRMAKPVCLVDFGDVPLAGSTGDSVAPLKALMEADLPFPSCVMLCDPCTVRHAKEVGTGNIGHFRVGTNDGMGYNGRFPLQAEVVRLSEAPFRHLGPAQQGTLVLSGARALLRAGNVHLIACENVCMTHDRNMLLTMGLDPAKMGIVVQKSTQSYKPNWKGVMGASINVDTPGYSRQSPAHYTFRRVKRPIYPLDVI